MDGNFPGATVVGSYPQPDWLIDREALPHVVSRARQTALWRVSAEYLETAQDDATLLAIREMEMAGVEVITDGEIRRESCSNRFATALDGVDIENPGEVTDKKRKTIAEVFNSPFGKGVMTLILFTVGCLTQFQSQGLLQNISVQTPDQILDYSRSPSIGGCCSVWCLD